MKLEDGTDGRQSRTRFFVVHNPNAGRSARRLFYQTLSALEQSGASITVRDTARHGEGTKASAQAAESGQYDAIVAAGGDGTVHDVAEGLVGRPIPLGIIPMGTGNVFSREIGLAPNAHVVVDTLRHGAANEIPIAQVNGHPFLFVVGIGFDAEAVRLFEDRGSREYGQMGFVWPVLRALSSFEDKPLTIRTDAGQREARWVLVTRVKRYAGNLLLAPDADLHDAHFHVLSIKGSGPLKRVRQLAALALGVIDHDPAVNIEVATRATISGDRRIPVQIDGEVLGQLPLDIGIHPQRIKILFPM